MQNLFDSLRIKTTISSTYDYTNTKTENLLRGLSLTRLNRYSKLASNNYVTQLQLYAWNTELSESLYTPIQGLEIITRNYFNRALISSFGEGWYEAKIQFSYSLTNTLTRAKETLIKEKKFCNSDNLISTLPFGFWTALLGPKYETSLWRPCLYQTFTNKSIPFLRKPIHYEFDLIRILRNRIAHHEPILRPDLPNHYFRIIKMINLFCKDTAQWIDCQSRFNLIWPQPINPFIDNNNNN